VNWRPSKTTILAVRLQGAGGLIPFAVVIHTVHASEASAFLSELFCASGARRVAEGGPRTPERKKGRNQVVSYM